MFWIRRGVSILIFALIVLFGFPFIGRWFFKHVHDNISQYIFVLVMVFLGSFLAQVAGMEAIIGAFLSGLALNHLIPQSSPLMNRVEFVGNAIFIPFFLLGVGMLIDYRTFFTSFETIKVGLIMIIVATAAKYIAAWMPQKTFLSVHGSAKRYFTTIFEMSQKSQGIKAYRAACLFESRDSLEQRIYYAMMYRKQKKIKYAAVIAMTAAYFVE